MNRIGRIAIAALLAGAATGTVNAQQAFPVEHEHNHKGSMFIGGVATYWKDTKDKTVVLDLCPEVGWLFNDDWGAGMLLGYEHRKGTETLDAFKMSPFVRCYYLHKGPFNLCLDGGCGWNRSRLRREGTEGSAVVKGFEAGIRPGACVDLTEGLCLCLRMGFCGWRKSYFSGEEEGIGENGFGVRFAPEELKIGLELEF